MARRSYTPERIINKLREAEVLLSQESKVGEAARTAEERGQDTHLVPRPSFR